MTLVLNRISEVPIKTWGLKGILPDVQLGDYEISMEDFCNLVRDTLAKKPNPDDPLIQFYEYKIFKEDFCDAICYVLTNTDLDPNDPRIQLVELIKQSNYNPDDPRIQLVEIAKQLEIVNGYNPGGSRFDFATN